MSQSPLPEPASPSTEPSPPEDPALVQTLRQRGAGHLVFGRFRLVRELGAGGMAVVWLGHDERLGLEVALKFLPGMVAADAEALHDLRREITRGLRLTHEGIVRLYDLHEESREGLAAIAMEYVEGSTLAEVKARQPDRCFDVAEPLLSWVRQLCAVLEFVHEKKVVHRDLKPRNIMLSAEGRVKVADFGIAATLCDSQSRLTQHPGSSGTPVYMSPQQALAQHPSAADDIYSLGATVYELLTSKPPFFRGSMAVILNAVAQQVPPSIAERRQELGIDPQRRLPIPETWERTIAACLAKAPQERPASVRAVLEALTRREVVKPKHPIPKRPGSSAPEIIRVQMSSNGAVGGAVGSRAVSAARAVPAEPPPAPRRIGMMAFAATVLVLFCAALGWLALALPRHDSQNAAPAREPQRFDEVLSRPTPRAMKADPNGPFSPPKAASEAESRPAATPPAKPRSLGDFLAEIQRLARLPGAKSDPALLEAATGLADLLKLPPIKKGTFDYRSDSTLAAGQRWALSAEETSAARHVSDILEGLSIGKESALGGTRGRLWVAAVLAELLKPRSISIVYAAGHNDMNNVDVEYTMEKGHLDVDREGLRLDYLGTRTFKIRPGEKPYPDGTRTKTSKGHYKLTWRTSRLAQFLLEDAIDPEKDYKAPDWMAKMIKASSAAAVRRLPMDLSETTGASEEAAKMNTGGGSYRDPMIESMNLMSYGGLFVDVEAGRVRGFGGGLLLAKICVPVSDR